LPKQLVLLHSLGLRNFFEIGPGDTMTTAVTKLFPSAVILNKEYGKVVRVEPIPETPILKDVKTVA
jgi:hypothetical protein